MRSICKKIFKIEKKSCIISKIFCSILSFCNRIIETSQTIPELVSWAKEREFSLNLPTERLVFLLAIAIYNNERLDGEMLEADLVDIFRHTANAFDQSTDERLPLVPIMLSMNW